MSEQAPPTKRAVFLDRDGVLNRPLVCDGRPLAPSRFEELEVLDGVIDACDRLRTAGFALVVVTNQPEVARGTLDPAELEAMHDALVDLLHLDQVRVCPHDDADACRCRKPKAGMLLDAAEELGLDLPASFLVGDRWRDVEAANAAGCRAIFVDWGWTERAPSPPFDVVGSLVQAADVVLGATTINPSADQRNHRGN